MFQVKHVPRESYALKRITIPVELHEKIGFLAEKYNLSYSEVVKQCIEYSVEKMEK